MIERKEQTNTYLITIFTLGLIFLSQTGFTQKRNNLSITETYMGYSLQRIFNDLEEKYNLDFIYEKENLSKEMLSPKFFKNMNLEQVIQKLLENTTLNYQVSDGNKILIYPKGEDINKKIQPSRFNFTLRGTIKEEGTNELLPNATVMIESTQKGAVTNIDGHFSVMNVPSDTSQIIVYYLGYLPKRIQLRPFLFNKKNQIEIYLEPDETVLQEVVVEDEGIQQAMKLAQNVGQISVSPQKMASLPSLGERDIFRSMQLLPGVSGSNETSAGLYVRGGTPDQNLILYDGMNIYHVGHFYGFFSAFNPNTIKDVQLYKGGFGAEYGGRVSSVVDITGKNGNTEDFSLTTGLSLLSANATMEIPLGNKASLIVAGRKSYAEILQSGLYQDIFDLNTSTPDEITPPPGAPSGGPDGGGFNRSRQSVEPTFSFYDLNTKLYLHPTEKDVITMSFYHGKDELQNNFDGGGFSFSSQNENSQEWGNYGASMKWGRQWNEKWFSNSSLSYSQYFKDINNLRTMRRPDDDEETTRGFVEYNVLQDLTLRQDNEYQLNASNTLKFGAQVTLNDVNYLYQLNDSLDVVNEDKQGMTTAIYLEDDMKINDKWNLKPGIRTTYYNGTDQWYIEPRLSSTYKITDRWKIKGSWGIYNQYMNQVVRSDVFTGDSEFWLLADDENVSVTKAQHFIGGISYETPKYLFDIEGYYKKLNGLTEYNLYVQRGPETSSEDYDEFFYQGNGVARGLDFLIQKKEGNFTGWLTYTLGQVIYDFDELADRAFYASHDQTHEVKLVTSYKWRKWDFGATWIFATGKPYTAPEGAYDITLPDGNTNTYFVAGQKNINRLPNYHRMDLSATYHFKLGNKTKGDIGMSIFNVYDNDNIWYKEFQIVDEEIVETDVNMLGFTPNVFLTLYF
ncbi:TonB-dependent receptor domain-containing protein [Sediminitomix flava]|uniref:TonB-dependent receptor-like protein n=1 Tax=Sediminitomix flava TaxID=379075 RepID=A0A315ZBL8_SEDFL|nr:TonB-dependent receptor [Sediminitomix flava]PWJ42941.1 TonB-dependent receptor-like protein [Sediminitomix flava]